MGLVLDRDELRARVDARVDAIAAAGARAEAEAAVRAGASRTARAALGFDAIREGDIDGMKGAQRAYARRQLTWMRKMQGVELIDRSGRDDDEIAREIVTLVR